ncbi:MFS general substrate transporter [Trametes polyzona]|nr:MFS general substrate transporter [Trametes polyzona]
MPLDQEDQRRTRAPEDLPDAGADAEADAEAERSTVVDGPPSEFAEDVDNDVDPEAQAPAPGPAVSTQDIDWVPDGGRDAWMVVLGSSLALFASAGMINAYGTFQDYYESTLLPSSSSSSIAFIGSLQVFLLYLFGTFTGRIFDAYGTKVVIPLGSFLCVFSLMMVSLCQKDKPYQVFLSHGLLFGTGIALLFSPSLAVLGHWFRKRRALAIGLTTGGSASGGVIFPILLEQLIPKLGFGWAVRITAFILLACLIVSCLTIRTRLPLSGQLSFRTAIDLGGFKDPRYTLATIGAFLLFYGFFIPYFYIQIYADFRGVSPHIGHYLLAILNAMNIPSRILPGYIADKVGTMNVFIPCAVICSVLILALWLTAHNTGAIVAFAALYGLFSGGFVSLLPTYIAKISPRERYGARLGSVYMIVGVATLVGSPTGGALLKVADERHFRTLIIFCGVMSAAGTAVLSAAGLVGSRRFRKRLRRVRARRRAERQEEGALALEKPPLEDGRG